MIKAYYKIRKTGTEKYYAGNRYSISAEDKRAWVSYPKSQVFTKQSINKIVRYWFENNIISIKDIQIVEYDLLERRGLSAEEFIKIYSKTPIIGL